MKIGVFGDSFAEKKFPIWWAYLRDRYGHDVDCFGEGSASILHSAKIINQKASDYDIAIWCVSSIGRLSVQHHDKIVHLTSTSNQTQIPASLTNAYKLYISYLWDESNDIFVSNAIINNITNTHKNIMLIPCFPDPLFSNHQDIGFNLFEISSREARYFFPELSLHDVWNKYKDLRAGHLTDENQQILANCINDNLVPGIFQPDYSNFITPTTPITKCFKS